MMLLGSRFIAVINLDGFKRELDKFLDDISHNDCATTLLSTMITN